MRTNYTRNIFRTVRSTFSRFAAIFAIVALGVGFLAGLMSSPDDMRLSADTYYDDTDAYDLRVVSTLGLTKDDLALVRQTGDVCSVMPAYDVDRVYLTPEGDAFTTRVHTLPLPGDPSLNGVVLQEGRMPEQPGECVVALVKSFNESKDWIGEKLTLEQNEDEEDSGVPETLTVVGTVKSALYLSMEQEHTNVGSGTIGLVIWTVPESFDLDYYTAFYLTLDGAKDMSAFTGAYDDKAEAAQDALEDLGEERSKVRYREIVDEANEKLNDARQEYEDGKAEAEEKLSDAEQELRDAEREIEENRQKLEDAKTEIADGWAELADAERELKDAEREIAENEQKLSDARWEIANGWAELADARKEYDEQIADAQAQIDDGYRQIEEYQGKIDDGRKLLAEGQARLNDGYRQLSAGNAQLSSAKAQLDQTEADLNALELGKAAFWQAVGQMGMPVTDTSDAATLAAIGQIGMLDPAAAGQFAPLKLGLEGLAAQGMDTVSARAALDAGKAEYERNLAAAQAAGAELDRNQALIDEQSAELTAQQVKLDEQKAELDSSAETLEQKKADAQKEFAEAEKKLNDAQWEYDDGARKLADGKQELADGWKEYNDGKRELEDAQREYDDGVQKLADGEKELADGWKEYRDSKAEADEELADAWDKITQAEEDIAAIEEGEWYVFTREDNAGFASYSSNADKIAAIAAVFPVFFFLVAALVALTTMTRMVEEERQQVGTMKALGYSNGKIAWKYLFYAMLASILGSVFGLLVGFRVFPYIIITAYNLMYDIPKALTPFRVPQALFSSLVAIACTLGATLSACWAELRESPASLMLPKAPKAGKRVFLEYITPLWKRMKFTQKVTARNLIRYKKRFFMTVIGIAGCTALLVTGFGVKDSISHIVTYQFEELNQYELTVVLKSGDALNGPELQNILDDKSRIDRWLPVTREEGAIVPDGDGPKDDVVIFVPEDVSAFPAYFTFRHRTDSTPVTYDENAVIITEKLAERHDLKVGDAITVKDTDEQRAAFVITDICENYVHHYLYISPAAFEEAFGKAPERNTILCKLAGEPDEKVLSTELLECDDVAGMSFTTEVSRSFNSTMEGLNSIVIVLIVSAGALAFVVLYNLTNINISERVKEIATIKVLGFYDGEVSAYIYRENAILTLIGDAVGLVLGVFLHQFVIRTAEIDIVMFGRVVYPLSFVWSALLTILFSVLVNLVMHRKLKKISMVESMKAPE